MSERDMGSGWEAATWEGNRRAQLRRALGLSVRDRLAVLEELCAASDQLAHLGRPFAARAARGHRGDGGAGAADPGGVDGGRGELSTRTGDDESRPGNRPASP